MLGPVLGPPYSAKLPYASGGSIGCEGSVRSMLLRSVACLYGT